MLRTKKCGRNDNRALKSCLTCSVDGVHRDLSFSKTNITTEESIHNVTTSHFAEYLINGLLLIIGIIKPRRALKLRDKLFAHIDFWCFYERARRGCVYDGSSYLKEFCTNALFEFCKASFSKTIQNRNRTTACNVAVYVVEIFNRKQNFIIADVADNDEIFYATKNLQLIDLFKDTNAVIFMNNIISGF